MLRLDGVQRDEGDSSLAFNNCCFLFLMRVGCFMRGNGVVSAFYLVGQRSFYSQNGLNKDKLLNLIEILMVRQSPLTN